MKHVVVRIRPNGLEEVIRSVRVPIIFPNQHKAEDYANRLLMSATSVGSKCTYRADPASKWAPEIVATEVRRG